MRLLLDFINFYFISSLLRILKVSFLFWKPPHDTDITGMLLALMIERSSYNFSIAVIACLSENNLRA